MRKGFSCLLAIIRDEFQADPTDGSLFLFINRRRDRMKPLHFADDGFWLYYRLLKADTFGSLDPKGNGASQVELDAPKLSMLLAGVSLVRSGKRRKRYAA